MATTYYIASAGNNGNAGTSPAAAWQTIAKVNSTAKVPGDQFLFNKGDTFTGGPLTCSTSGTSGNQILFGAYGTGAKPIISCGNQRAVYLQNCEYVTVQDIKAVGVGVVAATGLMADGSTFFLYAFDVESTSTAGGFYNGIKVLNVQATGVAGGVVVHSEGATTPKGFSNIEIGGSSSDPLLVTEALILGVYVYGSLAASSTGAPLFLPKGQTTHSTVTVHDFDCTNIYGIPESVYNTINFAGGGVVVANTTTTTISYGYVANCGAKNDHAAGPVGIFTFEVDGATIANNEINAQSTANGDGTGIDFDGGTINSVCEYNYVHDCIQAPFATGTFPGSNLCNNLIFRYNICEQNGGTSGIHAFNNIPTNVLVNNNTWYHDPTSAGEYGVMHGWGNSWTYTNNIAIVTGTKFLGVIEASVFGAVFQGNVYWSVANTPNWRDRPAGATYTTIAQWRASPSLVTPPETLGGSPVGQYGDPGLNSLGGGGTIHDIANMNTLLTAYDPSAIGSIVNSGGVGSAPTAADFHGNFLAGGAAVPVGAVYFNFVSGSSGNFSTAFAGAVR